jgi:hypothetical protein
VTSTTRSRVTTTLRAAAPLAIPLSIITILLRFPPAQNSFYPRCPVHELLHLQCPGCGATRALAALLHGRLIEALHFNALATLLLPIAAVYGVLCYKRWLQHRPLHLLQPKPSILYAAFALTAAFTILRNLPLPSF